MNSLAFALGKMGADPFCTPEQEQKKKEKREAPRRTTPVARIAGTRRVMAKCGGFDVKNDIQAFVTFVAEKASRDRNDSAAASAPTAELEALAQVDLQPATAAIARKFLAVWPAGLPRPEIGADPDGEVSFDWFGEGGRNFSVSLRHDGGMSYAGAFGESKTKYGTDRFDGDIPPEVVAAVRELRGPL
jgi:hypothetical protein